jgi:hypothetical protein
VANDAQPPAPAVDVLAGEAEPGIKIREVVDQLVEGIGVVLQCGGNGQAVTLTEEADDLSAKAGDASRIHQAKPPPKQGEPRAGRQLAADRHELALGAVGRQDLALDGFPQGDAIPVHRHAHGQVRNADQGENALRLVLEVSNRGLLLRQLFFHKRGDLFIPNRLRHLAPVPVGQAPDPFGEQNAVVAKPVGNREGATVDLAVLVFRQNAERAGADLFEGCGEGEDGAET